MKVMEMVLELLTSIKIQYFFMHEEGTIDAVFIYGRLQEWHHANGNNVFFLDLQNCFTEYYGRR